MSAKNIVEILEIESLINKLFIDVCNHQFVALQGPSGSGKTNSILPELSRKLSQDGTRVVYISADEEQQVTQLYAFEHLLNIQKYEKKQTEKQRRGIGKLIDGLSPVKFMAGLLDIVPTESIEAELMLDEHLTEKEVSILTLLNNLCSVQKCVLVIDHFAWLDRTSLKLLKYIFSPNKHKHLQLLDELVVLAILTDEHLALSLEKDISQLINQSILHKTNLPPTDKINKILKYYNPEASLSVKDTNIVYQFSKGHLEVLKIIASLLKNSDNINHLFKAGSECLLEKIYLLSFNKSARDISVNVLKKLGEISFLGDKFSKKQISCLLGHEGEQLTDYELQVASDLGIIEKYDTTHYLFTHEFHKNSLSSFVEKNNQEIHRKVSDCLKRLLPSCYRLRAYHLQKAGEHEKAAVMLVHGAIQLLSNKQSPLSHLNEFEAELLKSESKLCLIAIFTKAYEYFHTNRFREVILELEGLGIDVAYTLMAERDYLIALAYIEMHNKESFQLANKLVSRWSTLDTNHELELWSKLTLLRIQSLVLNGEISRAKIEESNLSQKLKRLQPIDSRLIEYLHIQNRKATSLKISEIAERNIKVALDYFFASSPPRYRENIFEAYKTLVNYTAVLINLGNFKEASKYCNQAFKYIKDNSQFKFQRNDILANNYVISSFKSGKLSIKDACDSQKKVTLSKHCNNDNHIQRSNYIGFLIIQGSTDKAWLEINSLKTEIHEKRIDESYITYNLFNNIMILNLITNKMTGFEAYYNKTISIVKGSQWPAETVILKRLNHIYSKRQQLIGKGYYQIESEVSQIDKSSMWLFYGNPVTLCELQFWASS
ncbi:AAA family ATPase [Pseudoalteromonas luteoviolacea]|uniref:AAA family ATPase n=1 Tax=Pseudoalteromonas luteoviolacea TaxID=43657 RepID=UPI00114E634B|nr:ATP-binding protein [Pseudoalteromonas luteoviolacea]TQF71064.1 ATP-binding protein [Pseudoalteromonas luteoviolacea]